MNKEKAWVKGNTIFKCVNVRKDVFARILANMGSIHVPHYVNLKRISKYLEYQGWKWIKINK